MLTSIRIYACQFKLKQPLVGMDQRPLVTLADRSNPWWTLLQEAVAEAGGELGKPEILFGSTDARYIRAKGIPAFGFSPIANTPILLHDHNEVLLSRVMICALWICFSFNRNKLHFSLNCIPYGGCSFSTRNNTWKVSRCMCKLWNRSRHLKIFSHSKQGTLLYMQQEINCGSIKFASIDPKSTYIWHSP